MVENCMWWLVCCVQPSEAAGWRIASRGWTMQAGRGLFRTLLMAEEAAG